MVKIGLCLVLAILASVSAAPESRIVGGQHTTIEEYPYIVSLVYSYSSITLQRCVGCLISSYHVLTTSYCFTGADLSRVQIRAGSTNSLSGGTVVGVREVIQHEDYVESPRTADIAVVVLSNPLYISNSIDITYLPPQATFIPDGTTSRIVSWGFESLQGPQLETLKYIDMEKISLEECQRRYEGIDDVLISDPVICANRNGPIGVCTGDSGAPMTIERTVLGLSSYFRECGGDEYPDVFTRIDRYTNWILSVASAPNRAIPKNGGVIIEAPRIAKV